MSISPSGTFRRLVYSSEAIGTDVIDILRVSRANNGMDGVTGVLVARGGRYVQVLEGPPDSVAATFRRIRADRRHTNIAVLSDTTEPRRTFADWAMAGLPGENEAAVRDRLATLLRNAPDTVRAAFADG